MGLKVATFTADKPGPPMNLNDREHHMAHAQRVATWRDWAFWMAKQHKLVCRNTNGPVDIWVTIGTKQPVKKRDPSNWAPTIKAICDGFTTAAVWADDDSEHVRTHEVEFTNSIAATQVQVSLSWVTDDE